MFIAVVFYALHTYTYVFILYVQEAIETSAQYQIVSHQREKGNNNNNSATPVQ